MARSNRQNFIILFSIISGVIIGLVISSNLSLTKNGFAEIEPESIQVPVEQVPISDLESTSRAFVEIAKRVTPAIVSITSEKVIKVRDPLQNFFHSDDFFRRFFKAPDGENQREYKQSGLGSGVIVSSDGYILTNYHVVKDADEIDVVVDKKSCAAKIIGIDPATDIAVIKIEESNLTAVNIGDSDALEVGELVLAIGSPFNLGLQHTVTSGIISAKGRALNLSGELTFQDFIQTDAAINPGNSGGALVNIKGQLIGINTAIYAGNTGGNIGIGFAIPVNLAKQVMADLIEHGKVVRGYLGVYIENIDSELSQALNIKNNKGAVVTQVIKDTPAEKAGLKEYDVIIKVNGDEIEDRQSLTNKIASYQPGQKVNLTAIRDGRETQIVVALELRPDQTAQRDMEDKPSSDATTKFGMELSDLKPELAERFGYENEEGVLVLGVDQNGIAAKKGMRAGDLIVEIDRKPVKSLRQLKTILDSFEGGKIILFQINRGSRSSHFVALKTPK